MEGPGERQEVDAHSGGTTTDSALEMSGLGQSMKETEDAQRNAEESTIGTSTAFKDPGGQSKEMEYARTLRNPRENITISSASNDPREQSLKETEDAQWIAEETITGTSTASKDPSTIEELQAAVKKEIVEDTVEDSVEDVMINNAEDKTRGEPEGKGHMLEGEDESSLQCATCCRVFKNAGALATHMKVHSRRIQTRNVKRVKQGHNENSSCVKHILHGVNRKSLHCPTCGNVFKNPGALATHMKSHSRNIQTKKLKSGCENSSDSDSIHSQPEETTKKKTSGKKKGSIVLFVQKPAPKVKKQRGKERYGVEGEENSCILDTHSSKTSNSSDKGNEAGEKEISLFQCESCDTFFTEENMLKAHMMRAHHTQSQENPTADSVVGVKTNKEKSNVCVICNKVMTRASDLKRHMRMHSGERYKCEKCGRLFVRKDGLLLHKRVVHKMRADDTQSQENPIVVSVVDSKTTISDENIDKNCQSDTHSEAVHSLLDNVTAKENIQGSSDKGKMLMELTDAEKESQIKLTPTSYQNSAPQKANVNIKIRTRKQSKSKLFSCKKCEKKFIDKYQFLKHIKLHLVSPKDLYKCSICKQPFKLKAFLAKHIKKCHPGESNESIEVLDQGFDRCFDEAAGLADVDLQALPSCGWFNKEKSKVCVICNKVMTRASDLKRHMRLHTGERHKCEQCGKLFVRKDGLLIHKRDVHRNAFLSPSQQPRAKYHCSQCGEQSKSRATFREHQETHGHFKCRTCTVRFFSESELQEHIKSCHSNSFTHVCTTCNMSFEFLYKLRKHMLIHKKDGPFKCNTCGEEFLEKKLLIEHKKSHMEVKLYPCGICGKNFDRKKFARRHELMHAGCLGHECSVCGKKFEMEYQLKRHMGIHSRETTRQDTLVNRNSSDSEKIQKEKEAAGKLVTSVQLSGRECKASHKVLKHVSGLREHVRKHFGVKYKCDFCPKSFSKFYLLSSHVRVVHQQILVNSKKATVGNTVRQGNISKLLFKCPVCGLLFIHGKELEVHTRIHTGEKPYQCDKCNEKFNSRDRLQEHLENSHDLMVMGCSICGKRFQRKKDLTRHIKTHNKSLSSYCCMHCGKGFARKDNMTSHIRRVHSN